MSWVIFITGILVGWIVEWIVDIFHYNRVTERLRNKHSQAMMEANQRYETRLEQAQQRHEQYIADLEQRHKAERNIADIELNSRLAETKAAHQKELELNRQHFDEEMRLLDNQYRAELRARDATYASARETLALGYREEVAQLRQEHEQRLRETGANLRGQYEEELAREQIALKDTQQAELEALKARLEAEYQQRLAAIEHQHMETLAQRESAHRHDITVIRADYEQRIDELRLVAKSAQATPKAANEIPSTAVSTADSATASISHVKSDDLTIIEGIGPKANTLLHEAGILSYQQLANTGINELKHILDQAGPHFRLLVPDTWPQQAELAARGEWEALDQLQHALDGGKPAHQH